MKSLSQAIVRLFESEMFYAELVGQMRRVINPTLPAAAGVCVKNGIELHINPTGINIPLEDGKTQHIPGFDEVSDLERVAILKHECEHILRDHIGRAKDLAPEMFVKDQDVADQIINSAKHAGLNVAMDCAINYSLPNLPKWACFPKNFDLPDGNSFEWYHDALQKNGKARKKLENLTGFDPHALWNETKDTKEVLKEKIRQAVNQAARNTRAAGRMTANDELLVQELNGGNSVDWRAQLRRFVAKSIATKVESSRKKRNRRYGIHIPGSVKIEELHIGVAKDSSGSVEDVAYLQFMKEIDNIAKYAKVTMLDADTEVKNVEEYKKGMSVTRKGYGGTAYQPALDHFSADKTIDAVIYFGDMDCYDKEAIQKPKYPVLWAIVGNQDPPANFGSQIRIEVT